MNHEVKDYCEDHPSNRTYVCVECADETTDSEIAALKASNEKLHDALRELFSYALQLETAVYDVFDIGDHVIMRRARMTLEMEEITQTEPLKAPSEKESESTT